MEITPPILTNVKYDFSKHIWLTDRTPVPSMYWEAGFPIIHSNLVYGINLEEPHDLSYLQVRANNSNYFACGNQTGQFLVQPRATFDKALDFCARVDMNLKITLTKQEKEEYIRWMIEEFGFIQNYRGNLWSDLVLYNETHYRLI